MYTLIHQSMYTCTHIHKSMYTYTYTLIQRSMYTYTHTYTQEYVHTLIKDYVYVYTHKYIGVCTHIHTHSYMGVCTRTQRVQIPGTHITASHLMHNKDLPGDKLSRPPYSPLALLQLKFGISQGVNSHVCNLVLYLLGILQKQLPATSDLQFWMWGRKHWQLILIFNTSFLLKRGRAGIHTVPTKPGREHPSFLTELTPTEQQGLMGIGSHRIQILESWALSSSLQPLVPASVTLTNIMTENNLGKGKSRLGFQITVGL